MSQAVKLVVMAAAVMFASAVPVLAQDGAGGGYEFLNSTAVGVGLVMVGAAFGIAKIGASAVESMARQPEKADDIRGAMIVAAALIEGATFFALIVCMLG